VRYASYTTLTDGANIDYYKSRASFQISYNHNDSINTIIQYIYNSGLFSIDNSITINHLMIPNEGFDFNTAYNKVNDEYIEVYWDHIYETIKSNAPLNLYTKLLLELLLKGPIGIYRRLTHNIQNDATLHPNGCCIPGLSRLFVSTTGEFYTCESFGERSRSIGNHKSGIEINSVKSIINDYIEISREDCLNCWAMHLCTLCYLSAYDWEKREFRKSVKRKACSERKKSIISGLKRIMTIIDLNPDYLSMYINQN
jgi:radical SAM protein with 4Fe4S-binding SPASM domain